MNQKMINIGIVAHVDAGKTTITEQFLYKSGVIRTLGRVDNGDTVTDSLSVEKAHGITVRTSTVSFDWKSTQINLLDTPGHMDFIAEVERSLSVLDGAILAISAKEGVQIQTRIIFEALVRLKMPTVIFINKVDRMGVDLEAVYHDIEEMLTSEIITLNKVDHTSQRDFNLMDCWQDSKEKIKLMEFAALLDRELLEKYANGILLTQMEVEQTLIKAFMKLKVFPILHGSALHGRGIIELLDFITKWLSPRKTESLYGRVYKIDRDRKGQRRCHVRLYGGQIKVRETCKIKGNEQLLKVAQLGAFNGGKLHFVDQLSACEVGVIYSNQLKIEDCIVADAPSQENLLHEELYNDKVNIASPLLKAAMVYEDLGQRKELLEALSQLTDEDPFLNYSINAKTDEIEVKIFGNVQREILESILQERFDIKVHISETVTIYKEKPLSEAEHTIYMYKEGNHLAATIGLKLEPLAIHSGFKFETRVSFGDLKKPFQNAVEEGVRAALSSGLEGWELTDLKVTFFYSEFNSVDSTPSDFRKLAPEVLKCALEKSGTMLLEPLLKFELKVPEENVGKAMSDILKMRGEVLETKCLQEVYSLKGIVPVDASKDYLMTLLNDTSGKGIFVTSFYGYREVESLSTL
ncbi:translation factor GTPase family protein [Fusibacter sp. 3D3]|uniref:elongation factor G n=1 Tax=Fusibacter sp. 3D3 TaxID=1048380 RepID=UPI0008537082|nr:TetM/TetW/TetO/TetS family tetracycline resistance ribosomal protection protein [Fusibacter sp. 3D3]GAU79532.1 ribosome protection-type tetracycline resistance related protein [Fusibacter sp. 3D3]